jgi:DNA topoisomerase I
MANSRRQRAPVMPVNPVESAKAAGLRYTTDARPGVRRRRNGSGFVFINSAGRLVRDRAELKRYRALVIPPAWTEVWICVDPRGHLQATGRDARGRKQYRYHPRWRVIRDETKYDRMIAFAQALPAIRRRTVEDLRKQGLPREKVLATVVQLLEKTLIRVGNDEYARHNQSFGLTTLRDGHVDISGGRVRFCFRGKSGVEHEVDLSDRRLARIVKQCRDLPGYDLFQYIDDNGNRQVVGSEEVNAYLKEITGQDFTSKDFRTWAGTVLAMQILCELEDCTSDAQARRNIVRAVEQVAKRLGNTKAVCRKSYIHPAVLDGYLDGSVRKETLKKMKRTARAVDALMNGEASVLAFLERRVPRDLRRKAS